MRGVQGRTARVYILDQISTDILLLHLCSFICAGQSRLPATYLGQITDGLYLISLLLKVSEQARMADQSTLLTQTDVVCPQTIPRLFHACQMVTFLENKKKKHFISSSSISHFFFVALNI